MKKSRTGAERILIIRLSAIGDVAMTAPVIQRLRENYPQLRITILTKGFHKPFMREIPDVEFFSPDFQGEHKGIRGIWRLYRQLGRFDRVADLHNVIRTKLLRLFMRLRLVRIAVIDKQRKERKKLTDIDDKRLKPLKPVVERYRDVFVKLGYDVPGDLTPKRKIYPLSPSTAAFAGERNGLWIGVAPFAQHEGKIYPRERMVRVIELLSQKPDTKIFIFGGGSNERLFAEQMQDKFPNVISAIGRMPLSEEIDLISNLDIMVSMDSSAMHMSSLVGLPVISVWGATHPFTGFYGIGQRLEDIVQADLPCRPCSVYGNAPCVYGDYRCMAAIEPEAIVEKVEKRLGGAFLY